MTFNNKLETFKVCLNGSSKQIDPLAEKSASGIWYENDQYELRVKGKNLVVTKNEKIVLKT